MTPLCYRCEYRARFLETGNGPRWECQQPGAVVGCYMYQPTRGVVLARDRGDRRPLCGPAMIAARAHGIRIIAEGHYVARELADGIAVYYEGGKSAESRQTSLDHVVQPRRRIARADTAG